MAWIRSLRTRRALLSPVGAPRNQRGHAGPHPVAHGAGGWLRPLLTSPCCQLRGQPRSPRNSSNPSLGGSCASRGDQRAGGMQALGAGGGRPYK